MATSPSSPPSGTSPPTAPTRNDPNTFRARMDAFLAWIVTFYTYLVSLVSWISTTATQVYDNAVEAATSATNASNSASAASGSASAASGFADAASGHADDAEAAAAVATAVDAGNALLAPNNLSDLGDAAAARTNLELSTVANTGAYDDLSGKPSIPSAANNATITLSPGTGLTTGGNFTTDAGSPKTITFNVDKATAANIHAGASNKVLTADAVDSALEWVTPSGASNWTPDWHAFASADWVVTGDRTINNPTNVSTSSAVKRVVIRGSTTTDRTITWGSAYVGNVPTEIVDNTKFINATLTPLPNGDIDVNYSYVDVS